MTRGKRPPRFGDLIPSPSQPGVPEPRPEPGCCYPRTSARKTPRGRVHSAIPCDTAALTTGVVAGSRSQSRSPASGSLVKTPGVDVVMPPVSRPAAGERRGRRSFAGDADPYDAVVPTIDIRARCRYILIAWRSGWLTSMRRRWLRLRPGLARGHQGHGERGSPAGGGGPPHEARSGARRPRGLHARRPFPRLAMSYLLDTSVVTRLRVPAVRARPGPRRLRPRPGGDD